MKNKRSQELRTETAAADLEDQAFLSDLVEDGGRRTVTSGPQQSSISKVINGGFCIGCGACSVVDPAFEVRQTATGDLRVTTFPADQAKIQQASRVCPFAEAPDEDTHAKRLFPDAPFFEDGIGRYEELFAGFSTWHRSEGGSGGLTRWLLSHLLDSGEIDYLVHVSRKTESDTGEQDLFYYSVHQTSQEYLDQTSTSAYYPVTLQGLFQEIAQRPGRCAVTALPCFARAIRSVIIERPEFEGKVRFISGTICGSLKSRRYAEYLALQMGVPSSDLDRINFRGKSLSRKASEKCVEVWQSGDTGNDPTKVARVQDLDGTKYGHGYFKYKACDYCDDVFAETADISFGDAWVPPFTSDPQGTNVIVVRNPQLSPILKSAAEAGEIQLETLTPERTIATQAGGLRHRRSGLQTRLKLARLFGAWVPRKRVEARWESPSRVIVQIFRVATRRVTNSAWLPIKSPLFRPAVQSVLLSERVISRCQRMAALIMRIALRR